MDAYIANSFCIFILMSLVEPKEINDLKNWPI